MVVIFSITWPFDFVKTQSCIELSWFSPKSKYLLNHIKLFENIKIAFLKNTNKEIRDFCFPVICPNNNCEALSSVIYTIILNIHTIVSGLVALAK